MNRFVPAQIPTPYRDAPEISSAALEALVASFVEAGGKIVEAPMGASAVFETPAPAALGKDRGGYNPLNAQMLRAHNARRVAKTRQRNRKPIPEAKVEKLRAVLNSGATPLKHELLGIVGVTMHALNRMLNEHFADDPRAARYVPSVIRKDVAARDAERVAKLRRLLDEGQRGREKLAKALGCTTHVIDRLARQYDLHVTLREIRT